MTFSGLSAIVVAFMPVPLPWETTACLPTCICAIRLRHTSTMSPQPQLTPVTQVVSLPPGMLGMLFRRAGFDAWQRRYFPKWGVASGIHDAEVSASVPVSCAGMWHGPSCPEHFALHVFLPANTQVLCRPSPHDCWCGCLQGGAAPYSAEAVLCEPQRRVPGAVAGAPYHCVCVFRMWPWHPHTLTSLRRAPGIHTHVRHHWVGAQVLVRLTTCCVVLTGVRTHLQSNAAGAASTHSRWRRVCKAQASVRRRRR